jgi:hypothetical protein
MAKELYTVEIKAPGSALNVGFTAPSANATEVDVKFGDRLFLSAKLDGGELRLTGYSPNNARSLAELDEYLTAYQILRAALRAQTGA